MSSKAAIPAFLTTEEVLSCLKVNPRTIYRLIKTGELPAIRIGRRAALERRVRAAELLERSGGADALVARATRTARALRVVDAVGTLIRAADAAARRRARGVVALVERGGGTRNVARTAAGAL